MINANNTFVMQLNIETQKTKELEFKPLQEAVKKHFFDRNTKRQTNRQDLSIDIHFAEEQTMLELNKQYRDKDYLTDVLSFSYLDNLYDHETLAGEIFISLKKAQSQAKDKGNSLEAELIYLISHGYLHITGYLHDTDEQEAEMNLEEDWILSNSGNYKINR